MVTATGIIARFKAGRFVIDYDLSVVNVVDAMAEHIATLENEIAARDSALRLANAGLEQLQVERAASKLAATQRSLAILDIAQSLVTLSAS